MGHLSASFARWRRPAGRWPRAHRRRWLRPSDSAGARWLLAVIPSLPRAELSRLTT